MNNGTYEEFRDALRAFESGWDRDRYDAGVIQDWQLNQWAGGEVTDFYPGYSSWSDLSSDEWDAMSYRSVNSLGFVGYQFGEPLLIDLGYYTDDVYYGNGAASNTWDGSWTGKNGVNSLEEFTTEAAQERAIQEAFGYNLQVIETGLGYQGESLSDYLGTTRTYIDNGQEVTVTLTMTGIMAAAHLRGAWGTLSLLQGGNVSTDEYGTSILRYIDQFGGYDAPSVEYAIKVYTDGVLPTDTGGGSGSGNVSLPPEPPLPTGPTGNGTANATEDTADVVITWAWGADETVPDFDPATDTILISWVGADALDVREVDGSVVIAIPSNNQSTTLSGVTLADLSPANFTILDSTAATEVLSMVGSYGTNPGGGGNGHNHQHMHVTLSLASDAQLIDGFMPAMGDVIEIGPDISADGFAIFGESGDALGQTVRIELTEGNVTKQIIFTGFGLADLDLGNFSITDQAVLNEISSALGQIVVTPGVGEGYELSYDADGSNPPAATGTTDSGGVKFRADSNADDITGFRPGVDQLDFGGTSVHGMIVTKSSTGEIVIDSPWSDAAQIVQGITYQDVTINDFGLVGNEHFRQDMGAVVSWEQGVGPRNADTIYVRSHEYGVHEVIDGFDPATMKVSFLYFGTRERLSVEDSNEGLVISSLPTGQSITLTGVSKADLIPGLVEFHHDQVMEDNLEAPFGFDQTDVTLVDRTILLTPEAPVGATTDGHQTRTGDLTGSSSGTDNGGVTDGGSTDIDVDQTAGAVSFGIGADVAELNWDWGVKTEITGFNATEDVLDFNSLSEGDVSVSEIGADLVFEVVGNGGHTVTLQDIQAEDLNLGNLTADDWNSIDEANSALVSQLEALGMSIA
ncbi:hypothetical protein RUE5091_04195 [Ruegeria denitrificans]|uniref:Uncharacterized protein n=1 Tax=Ruegeria denitrificans TaxID=1715692 RepID=A0A0P1IK23_9RHOB|nr:hypothetical protein [Ruegeria denitrificans]CUK18059.1 hypothetical protein RUE5091_04195 [Ruegeria denitrificans]